MPFTCRAAIAVAPNEPLRIDTVELRDPGPGEVILRLLATGLCHSDLSKIDGSRPDGFPMVLGHEGVGEVAALGPGVTGFAIGERVIPFIVPDCGQCLYCKSGRTNWCVEFPKTVNSPPPFTWNGAPLAVLAGLGTFSEMMVVRQDMLAQISPKATPKFACCIACGVTTGIGSVLKVAQVEAGTTVGVFGAGGVGLSVVQGARLAGAKRIIAIDTNPAREAVARRMGATDFIDARGIPDIAGHLREMTGIGLDYAFECVGNEKLARAALEATNLAWGLAVNVGLAPYGRDYTTAPGTLGTGRRWTGTNMGGAKRGDVAHYVDLYVQGEIRLDDLVSHELRLEDINHGFDMMRSGESVRSVILFDTAST